MAKDSSYKVFVSVGTRFSMNRLLQYADDLVYRNPLIQITAQVGKSSFQSDNINAHSWLNAVDFKQQVNNCDVFLSHAGMGNIMLAAELNKPIIVIPRLFEKGEHINNHQTDTANAFADRPYLKIAHTQDELVSAFETCINERKAMQDNIEMEKIGLNRLISEISSFID